MTGQKDGRGQAADKRHRVNGVRCLANEMVTFGYDGCAESWTVEGTDSKVFATVRGWVGPDGGLCTDMENSV